MQIPVALPHAPLPLARLDEVTMPLKLRLGPGAKDASALRGVDLRGPVPDLREVLQGILADLGGAPIGRVGRSDFGPAVKLRDRLASASSKPRRELAPRKHLVELRRAGKAAHLDAVFDGGAGPPQTGRILGPRHRHDLEIKLGGEAPVEP